MALFLAGAAGITSMQIGGRLADSLGARKVTLVGLPVLIAGAVVLGLAPMYPVAVVGAMLIGFGNGALDVAMNAIGVQVEAARGRAIMSFFHAMWSVGNFLGAGTVLLLATVLGLTGGEVVTPLMLVLSGLAIAVLIVLFRITPHAAVVEHKVDGVRTAIPRAAWLLGIMALGFGLSEGTAVDWSSLHVTDVAQVDTETGSLGLVAVSGFMVLIRLLGDRLVTRFGRRAVVRFGGATAAVGYFTVTLVDALPLLLVGWALVGFGVGMIAPQVYAVAGHHGRRPGAGRGGHVRLRGVPDRPGPDRLPGHPARHPAGDGRTGDPLRRHRRPGRDHAEAGRRPPPLSERGSADRPKLRRNHPPSRARAPARPVHAPHPSGRTADRDRAGASRRAS